MKTFLIALAAFGLMASQASADEPQWDKKKAAAWLDERAKWWVGQNIAQRATDANGKVACLCCHTTAPYALARPALGKSLPASDSPTLDKLLKDVDRRLVAWPTIALMYASNEAKKNESRGTEAILSAIMLAWNDASRGEAAPTGPTKKAFDRLWEVQREDGGWHWLRFSLEPWETRDAEYYGAALAALAVGTAPGYYTGADAALEKRVEALWKYLKNNRNKENLYTETWLLLASTALKGLLTSAEQGEVIDALKAKQKTDGDDAGGWVLLEFAKWRYNGEAPPKVPPTLNPKSKKPDGYATGLVTFTLLRAGVKADDPKVRSAIKWLKRNQNADGSWSAVSINSDRPSDDFAYLFMSDAATSWAVLALLEAEPKKP